MTTLRMVIDQMIPPVQGYLGSYTRDLAKGLVRVAPKGCNVEGIIASHGEEAIAEVRRRLGGLGGLHKTTLRRRELATAWQLGVASPQVSTGLIHSPTLLAPLVRHEIESGTQITVTLHDVLPWTHPKSLTPATVASQKTLLKRALKHADALVVPTHALAEELGGIADFGERVRVIPGAAPSTLRLPVNPDARAKELGLPAQYLLAMGTLEPRRGLVDLITAMSRPNAPDVPLLIIGPESWGDVTVAGAADEAGVAEGRVAGLGELADADVALVLSRATALIVPSVGEGFGMPLVEAFTFGTPVIHSDDPALVETAAGAGYLVEAEGKGYADRLAEAIALVLSDEELRRRLEVQSQDRAHAFSWQDSANLLWTLHSEI